MPSPLEVLSWALLPEELASELLLNRRYAQYVAKNPDLTDTTIQAAYNAGGVTLPVATALCCRVMSENLVDFILFEAEERRVNPLEALLVNNRLTDEQLEKLSATRLPSAAVRHLLADSSYDRGVQSALLFSASDSVAVKWLEHNHKNVKDQQVVDQLVGANWKKATARWDMVNRARGIVQQRLEVREALFEHLNDSPGLAFTLAPLVRTETQAQQVLAAVNSQQATVSLEYHNQMKDFAHICVWDNPYLTESVRRDAGLPVTLKRRYSDGSGTAASKLPDPPRDLTYGDVEKPTSSKWINWLCERPTPLAAGIAQYRVTQQWNDAEQPWEMANLSRAYLYADLVYDPCLSQDTVKAVYDKVRGHQDDYSTVLYFALRARLKAVFPDWARAPGRMSTLNITPPYRHRPPRRGRRFSDDDDAGQVEFSFLVNSGYLYSRVAEIVSRELGSDLEAWRVAAGLLKDWDGCADDLVECAKNLARIPPTK